MLEHLSLAVALLLGADAAAGEPDPTQPKPVPVTRVEVKEALDRLKFRKPRLPLEAPTEEEHRQARESGNNRGFGLVNNARMRAKHLPQELQSAGGFSREPDPNMTLKAPFPTELFWIVSRVNNCHYCLGHQEGKLKSDGLSDDQIAALDGNWEEFTPAERAAFGFTRKLTYEPHLVGDSDIAALREHYSELQTLEIVFLVSRYNSTNRWTDGLGIPQESRREYKTPTSDKYASLATKTAPRDPAKSQPLPAVLATRPDLEPRDAVLTALAAISQRKSRLPLVEPAATRELLPEVGSGPVPAYLRLLANFPKTGVSAARGLLLLEEKGRLSPVLRARIGWVAARHDRAWYALAHARSRLKALGLSDDEIFAADAPEGRFPSNELAVLKFAKKLTIAPQWIVDADIEELRQHYDDSTTAEIVHRATHAAMFDRLTEAAGLPLEQ